VGGVEGMASTRRQRAGVRFYAVRGRRDKMLVIQLKDETYERLITELEDLGEVAENINEAVGALNRS
jgi:hypothetical protein